MTVTLGERPMASTSDPPPKRRRPRMSVEAYFGDMTPANLRQIGQDTDRYGTPLWGYQTVRLFNMAREAWAVAAARARARGKPVPERDHLVGPDPLEPMTGVFVHTLGLWRRWARETQRMTADGVKQRHPNKGGNRVGDSRQNLPSAIAVRKKLPTFARRYNAEIKKRGVRPIDAMRAAAAQVEISESSGWRWLGVARRQGLVNDRPPKES